MSDPRTRTRTPRDDAARNRRALLAAATTAFAAPGPAPSLRAVARAAGLGVGTLYRHFPTRESLVDAVYHDQVQRLHDGARTLLVDHPPAQALRAWMDLFGVWRSAKHGMLPTLLPMIDAGRVPHARSRDELLVTISLLLAAGAADGSLRDDVSAEDLTAALVGIFTVAGRPDQREQADRLLDLLLDGVTARPSPTAPQSAPPTLGAAAPDEPQGRTR